MKQLSGETVQDMVVMRGSAEVNIDASKMSGHINIGFIQTWEHRKCNSVQPLYVRARQPWRALC